MKKGGRKEERKEGSKERNINRKEFSYNNKIKKSCTLQQALYNAQNGTRTDRQTDRLIDRETDRYTDRHADTKTVKQTDW